MCNLATCCVGQGALFALLSSLPQRNGQPQHEAASDTRRISVPPLPPLPGCSQLQHTAGRAASLRVSVLVVGRCLIVWHD